ncbi:MAG: hypothetical protein NC237_12160, partial [Eubacterium sp.]|nr:hypothetical protein [Eubacterium sp.]
MRLKKLCALLCAGAVGLSATVAGAPTVFAADEGATVGESDVQTLPAPTNVYVDENKVLHWDEVEGAEIYMIMLQNSEGKTSFISSYTNSCTEWWNKVKDGFVWDRLYTRDHILNISVCASDSSGQSGLFSETISYTYSFDTWKANFQFDENTGNLTWDDWTEVASDHNLNYEIIGLERVSDSYDIWNAASSNFGGIYTAATFKVPLSLAFESIQKPETDWRGEYEISLVADEGSEGTNWLVQEITHESSDTFTYTYDGCDVNAALKPPSNIHAGQAYNSYNYKAVEWDAVDGAIGYVTRITGSNASSGESYDYASSVGIYYVPVWDKFPDTAEFNIEICSIDKNGDRSEWSDPVRIEVPNATGGSIINPNLAPPTNIRSGIYYPIPEYDGASFVVDDSYGNSIIWDAVEGAVGYDFEIMNSSVSVVPSSYSAEAGTVIFVLDDTYPDVISFNVKVRSVDAVGLVSQWSDPAYIVVAKHDGGTPWTANFKYDEETGILTWDRNTAFETEAEALGEESFVYFAQELKNGVYSLGNVTMQLGESGYDVAWSEHLGITLPLELAYHSVFNEPSDMIGDIEVGVIARRDSASYTENLATDRFYYTYDGCDLNPALGTPEEVYPIAEGALGFNAVDGAVGYLIRFIGSDGIVHYSESSDSDCYWFSDFQPGAYLPDGDYNFEVCAVDNKGDRGEWSTPMTLKIVDKAFADPILGYPYDPEVDPEGNLTWIAAIGATGYNVTIKGENVTITERVDEPSDSTKPTLTNLNALLKNQADGEYSITITAFNESGTERTWKKPFTFTKVSVGFFDEENQKDPFKPTVDDSEKEIEAATPAEEKVESVAINPAFNLQLKKDAPSSIGALELDKITLKAKEIFAEEAVDA